MVMEYVAGKTLTDLIPHGRHGGGEDAALRRADRRCAGRRARRRHRASRPEAGQRDGDRVGPGEGSGFRPGQADHARRSSPTRRSRWRARDGGGRDPRHRQLHVAGAGAGRQDRCAQRHLLLRLADVRNGDGQQALSRTLRRLATLDGDSARRGAADSRHACRIVRRSWRR